jgi:hypothetical protein
MISPMTLPMILMILPMISPVMNRPDCSATHVPGFKPRRRAGVHKR